jgi:gliding motility-associated protein GldM
MGHGKETPRQKMIGMMYLVLTAMLALNVSKEVVNAFVLVDVGLVTTTENFSAKNASLYTEFAKQYQLNPTKTGDWKDKSDEVHKKCNDLYDFIYECKEELLMKKDEEAIDAENKAVIWDNVHSRDNMDYGGEIMIINKKGTELKEQIEGVREYMLSLIEDKEKYSSTVESIEAILSTELPDVELDVGSKNVAATWETTYFNMLPLASVITLLSKMQADVRNAEAEIIEYLLGQVVAGDIGFNTIRPVVMADRSLVFPGEEYNARVFLAAYDSTKAPEVQLEDGTMLEVESGQGIYTATSNTLGIKTWGGTIKLESDGQVIEHPFEASYEVARANATISATAMNVFYRGLNNPVAISAGGVAESSVRATITSPHSIKRVRAGEYVVKPGVQGDKATVSVFADIEGTSKLMTRMDFRVLDLPTPVAKITGSKAGQANLTISQLTRLEIVEAEAEDFLFEVDFEVTEFKMGFSDASGIYAESPASGNRFTSDMKAVFRTMRPGQKLSLVDIKAIGPDGKVRALSPINVTVR